jgi:hypothetical protein
VALGGPIQIVPADEATRLPALLIAPSDPVRLGAANRALERLDVPWRFGAARRDTASVVTAADSTEGGALASADRIRVNLRYPLAARDWATRRVPGDGTPATTVPYLRATEMRVVVERQSLLWTVER